MKTIQLKDEKVIAPLEADLLRLSDEAELIAGHWNGSDATFVGGDGLVHSEDEAQVANELMESIRETISLMHELHGDQ